MHTTETQEQQKAVIPVKTHKKFQKTPKKEKKIKKKMKKVLAIARNLVVLLNRYDFIGMG